MDISDTYIWRGEIFGANVLVECHENNCSCSYCQKFTGKFGIALPENKGRTSWRVIWWRYNDTLNCIRWTLPSLKFWKFKNRHKIKATFSSGSSVDSEQKCG